MTVHTMDARLPGEWDVPQNPVIKVDISFGGWHHDKMVTNQTIPPEKLGYEITGDMAAEVCKDIVAKIVSRDPDADTAIEEACEFFFPERKLISVTAQTETFGKGKMARGAYMHHEETEGSIVTFGPGCAYRTIEGGAGA